MRPGALLGAAIAVGSCARPPPPAPFVTIVQLDIRPASPIVAAGRRIQLVAEATADDLATYDQNAVVAWSSSDDGLCTVNGIGQVRGVSAGRCAITAVHPSGPTATRDVTVIASDVTSIAVTPADRIVPLGSTLQLTATATLMDASALDVTAAANWQSNNVGAVSVEDGASKGLAAGVGPGTATVAATYLGIRGTAYVTCQ